MEHPRVAAARPAITEKSTKSRRESQRSLANDSASKLYPGPW